MALFDTALLLDRAFLDRACPRMPCSRTEAVASPSRPHRMSVVRAVKCGRGRCEPPCHGAGCPLSATCRPHVCHVSRFLRSRLAWPGLSWQIPEEDERLQPALETLSILGHLAVFAILGVSRTEHTSTLLRVRMLPHSRLLCSGV